MIKQLAFLLIAVSLLIPAAFSATCTIDSVDPASISEGESTTVNISYADFDSGDPNAFTSISCGGSATAPISKTMSPWWESPGIPDFRRSQYPARICRMASVGGNLPPSRRGKRLTGRGVDGDSQRAAKPNRFCHGSGRSAVW